ncbi:MAG: TolC family protein [bacterium]
MFLKKNLAFGLITFLLYPAMSFSQSSASGPLSLEQCVQLALKQNSQLLNAQRRVRVAETEVTRARSAILPRISSTLRSNRQRIVFDQPRIDLNTGRILGTGVYQNTHSMSFSFNQNVFDFGASWNTIRQASSARESSVFTAQATRQNTVFTVYQNYYQMLKDVRLLEVYEEAVKQSEEQLKRTQSMYEIGSVARVDVYRAQTQLGNDKINLVQQRNAIRLSRAALNVTVGRNADDPLDIKDPEDVAGPAKPYNIEEVMNRAVQSNPNISRFKSDMKSASYGVKVAKANFLPSFFLFASYSRDDSKFTNVYQNFDQNFFANVGVTVSFNIFNGFSDWANHEREATNYRIAQENLVDQERQIRQQVMVALLNLQGWKEISDINEENLNSTQEELRLAQERYRVGAGTLLDVQIAQTNLTRAKSTLVRAKYDTKIAEAQLQAAMGTLQ